MGRALVVVVLAVFIPLFLAPMQAGAVPLIEDVYAVPSVLGPAGGTVTVLGWETSIGPATCQLRFDGTSRQQQPQPSMAYSRTPRPCDDTVVARVTIGALLSSAPQALSFTLAVRNVRRSMSKAFSVTMEPERLWVDAGAPVQQRASRNWSGYVLMGGPYTAVTGTFQVPLVFATAGCRDRLSEWVGVGGVGNQDLLQAGISEQMSNVGGACTRHPHVWAWWEVLPWPADPFVTLAVQPGQWVTVTIADIFGSWWFVGMFNDSTDQRISTEGLYGGPHSSAEWVVEAPSSNLCSAQSHVDRFSVCDMAAFNGRAPFTGLDAVGPTNEMAEVDLVQHAVQVASPSPVSSVSQLLAQGFDVTYSGLDRPAPPSVLATEPTMQHQQP
jgi:Peptidase A4 family